MTKVRVLIADDHNLVRAGIRSLLAGLESIEVVGEARDGSEALELAERHRPHVVLMDIAMPVLNGVEAATRLTRRLPGTRVIILSMHSSEEYALRALRAGAVGYLLKSADPVELWLAIRAVMRGEKYLSPAVSKHVIDDYVRRTGSERDPWERLTPRQRELLQLIAEGQTTKEIAKRLALSVKTVENHRMRLMERLDVHDLAGLVRYAIRMGVVSSAE